MNTRQFCVYLKGCIDINEGQAFSSKQVQIIREKLNSLFEHKVEKTESKPTSTAAKLYDKYTSHPLIPTVTRNC